MLDCVLLRQNEGLSWKVICTEMVSETDDGIIDSGLTHSEAVQAGLLHFHDEDEYED